MTKIPRHRDDTTTTPNNLFFSEEMSDSNASPKNDTNKKHCFYCDTSFSRLSSLTRHQKVCEKKKALENKLKIEVEKLRIENEKLRTYQKHTIEKEKMYKDQAIFFKTMLAESGSSSKPSMGSLLYKHCDNAPVMKAIDGEKIECLEKTRKRLVEDFLLEFRHKTLHEKLSAFIIKEFTKDDITCQSIFNTDTTRFSYIIRELILDDTSEWVPDKNGVKATKYMITPLLIYIRELLNEHQYNNITPRYRQENMDIDTMEALITEGKTIIELLNELDDGIMSKKILRFIGPYFKFDKNKLKAIIGKPKKTLPNKKINKTRKLN